MLVFSWESKICKKAMLAKTGFKTSCANFARTTFPRGRPQNTHKTSAHAHPQGGSCVKPGVVKRYCCLFNETNVVWYCWSKWILLLVLLWNVCQGHVSLSRCRVSDFLIAPCFGLTLYSPIIAPPGMGHVSAGRFMLTGYVWCWECKSASPFSLHAYIVRDGSQENSLWRWLAQY